MGASDAYDAYYYNHCCGRPYARTDEWLQFFATIADRIVQDAAPSRVLDAGCAWGFLVESLRERGVDAWGIDLSPFAIERVHPPIKPFCRMGSITEDLGGQYDLIVSIEVVEHMPTRAAEDAIANFCAHTTDVLFSSSPLDHKEPTHTNVHEPDYWAELFARHDFVRDVDYDATFITPWAARFRKRREPVHRVLRDYERRYWALLHEAQDARQYSAETHRQLGALEQEIATLRAERDALRQGVDDLSDRLRQALDRIGHMERSAFWKARRAWRAIRRRQD